MHEFLTTPVMYNSADAPLDDKRNELRHPSPLCCFCKRTPRFKVGHVEEKCFNLLKVCPVCTCVMHPSTQLQLGSQRSTYLVYPGHSVWEGDGTPTDYYIIMFTFTLTHSIRFGIGTLVGDGSAQELKKKNRLDNESIPQGSVMIIMCFIIRMVI